MKTRSSRFYLNKAAQGIFISLFLVVILLAPGREVIVGQMLLYETMPNYRIESEIKNLLGLETKPNTTAEVFSTVSEDNLETDNIIVLTPEGEVIGLSDDIYRQEDKAAPEEHTYSEAVTEADISEIQGIDDLKSKFYVVDKRTGMTSGDFNIAEFMDIDLTIDRESEGPKILVFHTHSTELYSDSADESEGVIGLGSELCNVLQNKYGIEALHVQSRFDVVGGKSQILGAYERMEPAIRKILAENPSVEMVIDLHRDGVEGGKRFVTNINEKPTAQIMFVNGLSKIYKDGALTAIDSLPNPNQKTNLALSFRAQLSANKLYPGFARKLYLNAYRYSLHMMPKSLLIEVGAQTNTKSEAFNAVEPLADILASVILK